MKDCLFCQIISGAIPADKVYESDNVLGIKDIYPQAKEHYLFIHKEHTKNINEMAAEKPEQLAELFKGIQEFTSHCDLERDGFRLIMNTNKHGCQSVFHTHVHLLGGEQLSGF